MIAKFSLLKSRNTRLLLALVFFMIGPVNAQFNKATIGIDGLTCSMCSNSVEKLLRQLDFVEHVTMDLNQTTAEVLFKPGKKVSIRELSQKVFDSGFSVRSLKTVFTFNEVECKEGNRFVFEGDEYIFLKAPSEKLNGAKEVTFIGKKFMSPKEFNHWKNSLSKYKGTLKIKSAVYHIVL